MDYTTRRGRVSKLYYDLWISIVADDAYSIPKPCIVFYDFFTGPFCRNVDREAPQSPPFFQNDILVRMIQNMQMRQSHEHGPNFRNNWIENKHSQQKKKKRIENKHEFQFILCLVAWYEWYWHHLFVFFSIFRCTRKHLVMNISRLVKTKQLIKTATLGYRRV